MFAFTKLAAALSLVSLVSAFPSPEAWNFQRRAAAAPTGGSICSTKNFDLMQSIPEYMMDDTNLTMPLTMPNTSAPVYTALSVGMQNYTCGPDATWKPLGGLTFLFDISCLPQAHHKPFTSFVAALWDAAPVSVSNDDILTMFETINPGTALGLHFWIADPNNATDGKINGVWDFRPSERYVNDTNRENAYLISGETGNVPDPINPVINSPWLYEPALYVDGKKAGQLADQVYRFNSNGGQPPNSSCTPGMNVLQSKSTLNFWFYGGAWENTIQ